MPWREGNQGEKLPEIARSEGLEVLDTRGRFWTSMCSLLLATRMCVGVGLA